MSELKLCSHLSAIQEVITSKTNVCDECVKQNTEWVHLRVCQNCGATLCCDDSPEKHMSKHNKSTGHPVIASAQPGERWLYCYVDDSVINY